jgi:hypothetical protein
MTPRQETSLERAFGRMEGQMVGMAEKIDHLVEMNAAATEWRASVSARLDAMDVHRNQMTAVATAFDALQQSIRDGKMQAKGVMIGIGLAAGAGGATVATGLKWAWAAITGA